MKTTLKSGLPEKPFYRLEDLENEAEMSALIREYEATLRPCTHCGATDPAIEYEYRPCQKKTHTFYVGCFGGHAAWRVGCWMQTAKWDADDDGENKDIRDALFTVCSWWNRRPGEWENSLFKVR